MLAIIIICYLFFLFLIGFYTSRKTSDDAFYTGNRRSPWYVVSYGMVGASLSGVTYLSVPGWVASTQFSYMMVVLGFVVGYAVVAYVLLPLYYRLKNISIYTYLEQRFGVSTYKTGASFFILSRLTGASLRMFLAILVLDMFVFAPLGIPFWVLTSVSILLVLLYSFQGGIKTIVWTDTLQTTFMLLSVGITIYLISKSFDWSFSQTLSNVWKSEHSNIIVSDWTDRRYFIKQFFSGIFITIAMTGLDMDMMQKNLSCRTLAEAQKNMFTFSLLLIPINLMFLILGTLLLFYVNANGINSVSADGLFAQISVEYLGFFAAAIFFIGLIAAALSSADGALTAITTSFCIDIVKLDKRTMYDKQKQNVRHLIHFGFAILFILLILIFKQLDDKTVVDRFFTIAGYTYGPLLGLYSFGLYTKRHVRDRAVPFIAIASPVICYFLDTNSIQWFNGYQFGFELLILNALVTFIGLRLVSK
jgi:Na+/proline symporter